MSELNGQVAQVNSQLRGYHARAKEMYGDKFHEVIGGFQRMLALGREEYDCSDQEALMKLTAAMAERGTPFPANFQWHFGAAIVENSIEGGA